jgi:hypothetical protein
LTGRFFGGDYDFMVLERAFREQGLEMVKSEVLVPGKGTRGYIVNK